MKFINGQKNLLKLSFFLIVAVQLFVIAGLLKRIVTVKNTKDILGLKDVAVDEDIFKPENSEYDFYYELKPSRTKVEKRFWDNSEINLTINSDGLNERFDYPVRKPSHTYRIITLGDSFTYGQFVTTASNWTERLEDMLNDKKICPDSKYEVINLGMLGFDIPYIIKRFRDIGLKYDPDLIVWFESGSGFYRDREKMGPKFKACENETRSAKKEKFSHEDYWDCWLNSENEIKGKTSPEDYRGRIYTLMEDFLRISGDTPVIIASSSWIEPAHEEILGDLAVSHPNLDYTKSISLINIENGTALSEFDPHPNEKGHELMANDFFNYLATFKNLAESCRN